MCGPATKTDALVLAARYHGLINIIKLTSDDESDKKGSGDVPPIILL
jgi:hypothetical protein